MNIKELFEHAEGGTLTYAQFEQLAKDNGAKFTDLSDGKYVSKSKYETDLKAKDTEIESLTGTISTRDADLAGLQEQLKNAGNDATKLAELSAQFEGLQTKYDSDVQAYQAKMQQQAYEFAVKDFANTKKFSSQAAKRDFIQSMIARQLQMDGDKILGREDFADKYSEENADAFIVSEEPLPTPTPTPAPVPEIIASAQGIDSGANNDSGFHFNFTGVRAH